ncbi:MAG: hypothetical protein A3F11_02540 [Gammaproteobacteria bacterium RIFCSPHIGHO2_12_FULL_37_14]|nr:MAG: hypothetical protein A3F11_02540 [Gammaproteobacteria bacterium RIFCSPHIGHO2_12_FULL_37_14]
MLFFSSIKNSFKKLTNTPMSKMLTYVTLFFALVFSVYGGKKLIMMWYMSHYQPPPVTISATKAKGNVWQTYITTIGTLTAIHGVDLSANVAGIVKEIRFNSGQIVKKGDVIILLDMDIEQATLKSSQAKLELAKIDYAREKKLFDRHVASQATLDTRFAELLEAQGNVESIQAQIQQKTITAPFDGRLGIRQMDLGQYLPPGAPIVTLQSMNPLYVLLNIPEKYLSHLYINQVIDVVVDIGNDKIVKGKITAINSKVDHATRNVLVQAMIPNDKYELYPGMFASTKVWFRDKKNTVVVPQTAISYSLSGDYVFVVKDESKSKKQHELHVYRQYVTVAEQRGTQASITSGIQPDDLVVISGQLKLQNGTSVIIDNSVEL